MTTQSGLSAQDLIDDAVADTTPPNPAMPLGGPLGTPMGTSFGQPPAQAPAQVQTQVQPAPEAPVSQHIGEPPERPAEEGAEESAEEGAEEQPEMAVEVSAPAEEPLMHKRIRQFIELRDYKEKLDEEHKVRMAPINNAMMVMHTALLEQMNVLGTDSVKVRGVGTAYINIVNQVSIADGHEFRRFVVGSQLFNMLDWKANANAVAEWTDANKVVPPGINFRRVMRVGVRRDSPKPAGALAEGQGEAPVEGAESQPE